MIEQYKKDLERVKAAREIEKRGVNMAQLYKMTLYVCDLNDNLTIDEIKTLIKERALDGISVNTICHFTGEKIGKRFEWSDDVDVNKINCCVSALEKYFD